MNGCAICCPGCMVGGDHTPDTAAARGLKLLSAKHRRLHPAAQVQTLRRSAVRSLSKADWLEELAVTSPELCPLDTAKVAALRAKAEDAMQACLFLNRQHDLGYKATKASP